MPMPDARTRSKISLTPSKVLSPSLPKKALPRILIANVLYVVALKAMKELLLDTEVGVMWVLLRVLVCGGLGVLVWEVVTKQVAKRRSIEWSALALASFLLFLEYGSLLVALYRLQSTRVILFAHFSTYWVTAFTRYTSAPRAFAVLSAFAVAVLSDTQFSLLNLPRYLPGYGALVLHAASSLAANHTIGVLTPSLGSTFTISAATLGASLFAIPFYMFRSLMLNFPPSPSLSFTSLLTIPLVAYSVLFMTPLTAHSFDYTNLAGPVFTLSFPTLAVLSGLLGALAFSHFPNWSDFAVAALLFYGMTPQSIDVVPITPRAPTTRLMKSYLKSILANPESRKIFYFLMLNMAYMLVQMLYGVWTNSLGLISDAIHMAFDCMAIGVGLLASVMATWDPTDRFTYGYGRIETLSGFANGIFLILISIFIIFEAIQRILDPPEMSTNQLLLVSSVGLGVNLFGMFAMGGHHHHGGGGHSHSHGHSHSFNLFGGGDSDHAEDSHNHSHDHSHSHSPKHQHSLPTLHVPSHSTCDDHGHHSHSSHSGSHKPAHSHSHSHSPPDEHQGHSHSPHVGLQLNGHDDHCAHSDEHDDHSDGAHHHHSHDSPSHSPTQAHSHSHSPSHSRSHSPSPPPVEGPIPVGHSRSLSKSDKPLAHRRHSRAASLAIQIHNPDQDAIPVSYPSPAIHVHPPDNHGHSHSHSLDDSCLGTHAQDDHHEHGHSHGHEHEHEHAILPPATPSHASHGHAHGHSHNMRGVFLHVMADTLGSVGVIISTLLIQFYGWTGFDPIASLFIAVLIAASVIPLVIDTGKILALDVSEKDREIQQALDELSTIEGLASYSCPRFWPKDASSVVGSIHIQLAPSAASSDPTGPHSSVRTTYARMDRVVERVDEILKLKIEGLDELTVQVEGRGGAGRKASQLGRHG